MSNPEETISYFEDNLHTLNELLADYEKTLSWLTSADYDPEKNQDHEFRDQDIADAEGAIAETKLSIERAKSKIKEAREIIEKRSKP